MKDDEEARTAFAGAAASISANTAHFTSSRSGPLSCTKSAPPTASASDAAALTRFAAAAGSLTSPCGATSRNDCAISPGAAASVAGSGSHRRTSQPARANTFAQARPIRPTPARPTVGIFVSSFDRSAVTFSGAGGVQHGADGALPAGILALALGRGQRRLEGALELPEVGEAFGVGPYACLVTGEPGRAERRRFLHDRPLYRRIEDVGQELHGPVARHHAAVHPQHGFGLGRPIVVHGLQQIPRLVADGFQRRAGDLLGTGASGEPEERAA